MREILELMNRLDTMTEQYSRLQMFASGNWGIYSCETLITGSGTKQSDDPTADIIAALKAKLPPTKEEALADLDAFIKHTPYPYSMAQNTHLQTVRRYLEAQKE